mmetsp:Transcript_19883/g.41155  ORF Transcript_19883/g.41155 Transcript_19883/m.41155 type:complete len:93 (-) Transcript_19883:366-644(-)
MLNIVITGRPSVSPMVVYRSKPIRRSVASQKKKPIRIESNRIETRRQDRGLFASSGMHAFVLQISCRSVLAYFKRGSSSLANLHQLWDGMCL